MEKKLSIKRINRLIGIEKPKAIARYLRGFKTANDMIIKYTEEKEQIESELATVKK